MVAASMIMLRAFHLRNVASLSSSRVAKFIRPFRSLSAANNDVIIGIDLGTTNSRVAIMNGEHPEVIVNSKGARTIPSVVAFVEGGNMLTGTAAKKQSLTNIPNTIFSTKRFIGRDCVESYVPYAVVNAPNGIDIWVQGYNTVDYSPSQIAAFLIKELKETAESYLSRPISKAVITVPAHFNIRQRKATKDAGRIAGLDVARLISEPNAAALSCGLLKRMEGTIVVFNLGGGQFNVSVLKVSNNSFEVLASKGCSLGGVDFDEALQGVLVNEFRQKYGIYLGNDTLAYERIREAAEKAKIQLSWASKANIELPFLYSDDLGAKHLNVTVTRNQFEMLVRSLTVKIEQICIQCLQEAGMAFKIVDEVIAVGGMTKVPIIQSTISSVFGKNPIMGVDQDEAVVKGAAIQGGILCGDVKKLYLRDATPFALEMRDIYAHTTCLIEKHTPIPLTKCHVHKGVDVKSSLYQRGSGLCEKLGVFKTSVTPPGAVSTYNSGLLPEIKLSFHIDDDGILSLSAMEQQTQKQLQVSYEGVGGLTEEEIETMMLLTEEEKKKKLVRHFRETAIPSISEMEKSLNEYRQKVFGIVEEIESSVSDLRRELEGDNMEEMKAKLEAARNAVSKIEKGSNGISSFSEHATANAISDHDQNSDGDSNNDDSDIGDSDDSADSFDDDSYVDEDDDKDTNENAI